MMTRRRGRKFRVSGFGFRGGGRWSESAGEPAQSGTLARLSGRRASSLTSRVGVALRLWFTNHAGWKTPRVI